MVANVFIPWPALPETFQGFPRAGALITDFGKGSERVIQWFDPEILFYFQVWDRLDGHNGSRLIPDIALVENGDISIAALHSPWLPNRAICRYSVKNDTWVEKPEGDDVLGSFATDVCSVLSQGLRTNKLTLEDGESLAIAVDDFLTIHANVAGKMYRLLERDSVQDDDSETSYRHFGIISAEYPVTTYATLVVRDTEHSYWAPGTNPYTHPSGSPLPQWLADVVAKHLSVAHE